MSLTPSYASVAVDVFRAPCRHPVVAIGGLGGSGTRVGAALLRMLGYYIGDELNASLDNLWFTLLFKRHESLRQSEAEFAELVSLFWTRMSCAGEQVVLSEHQEGQLFTAAEHDRLQHSKEWLVGLAHSFVDKVGGRADSQPWGWKEPNTHLVIDKIFHHRDDVKYIHFVRHPLDMAFSTNQNQLRNWGPLLLDRTIQATPRFSLNYWCAAHRRILKIARAWPRRVLIADFDALTEAPNEHCDEIESFLDVDVGRGVRSAFENLVDPDMPSRGRLKVRALDDFDRADIDYIQELGYQL